MQRIARRGILGLLQGKMKDHILACIKNEWEEGKRYKDRFSWRIIRSRISYCELLKKLSH